MITYMEAERIKLTEDFGPKHFNKKLGFFTPLIVILELDGIFFDVILEKPLYIHIAM